MMTPCVCRTLPDGTWTRAIVRPFTKGELRIIEREAQKRLAESKRHRRKDKLGWDSIESHRKGCMGEMGFRVFYGLPPVLPLNEFHGPPDIPPDTEVRFATDGRLKIREDEAAEVVNRMGFMPMSQRRYAVLTPAAGLTDAMLAYLPEGGSLELGGWAYGYEVEQRWLSDPGGWGPAYFIPREHLHRFPFHKPKPIDSM